MLPPDLKTVINSPRFGVRFININENFSHRPMAFKFYQYLFLLLLFISIKVNRLGTIQESREAVCRVILISNSVLTKAYIKFRRSRLRFETFYKITQKHFNVDQFYQRIKKNDKTFSNTKILRFNGSKSKFSNQVCAIFKDDQRSFHASVKTMGPYSSTHARISILPPNSNRSKNFLYFGI